MTTRPWRLGSSARLWPDRECYVDVTAKDHGGAAAVWFRPRKTIEPEDVGKRVQAFFRKFGRGQHAPFTLTWAE